MSEGFFTLKQTQSLSRPDGKTYSCASCGLHKRVESPKMPPFGEFRKRVMIIGEAPGKVEDKRGKPWQGKTGRLLQRTLQSMGVDLFEDCLCVNACFCRPTDDGKTERAPTNYEVDSCRATLIRIIQKNRPRVIILLGNSAVYALLGHRWKKNLSGIMKWRGWTIPDQDFHTWLCPTFHPSYVARMDSKAVETIWEQDLREAFNKTTQPLPPEPEPEIVILNDLERLNEIEAERIAFDYETTGIKPQASGHRIVCASIAVSESLVYAFLMPPTKSARRPFTDLLANPKIKKMAHNIKFEETWSVTRLRQPVVGWEWDSMMAAHILDNRPGVTGLKFQAYVQFGIIDYASEVDAYLQSVDRSNGNSLNRVLELIEQPGGAESLLKYCALDSAYEYQLAMIQMSQIK